MEKNVGEKLEVVVTFPDKHPREDFRGKKANFHVSLTDQKEKILPDVRRRIRQGRRPVPDAR